MFSFYLTDGQHISDNNAYSELSERSETIIRETGCQTE
jgi:hypothetical protein